MVWNTTTVRLLFHSHAARKIQAALLMVFFSSCFFTLCRYKKVSSVFFQTPNLGLKMAFLSITAPAGELIPLNRLTVSDRSWLWIDSFARLSIPNDSVALVNSSGILYLGNGTVHCYTPGCTLNFDRGTPT